jgi:transcription initiation factor TFIIB
MERKKRKRESGNGEVNEIEKINGKTEIICSDCKSRDIIKDEQHGEIICGKCGLVIEEKTYDSAAEYAVYDSEQRVKRERTGSPLKFSKQSKGLVTEIDKYDRDIRGRSLPVERIAQMHRLRKWHKRTRLSESSERNLSIALNELNRMCSYLNIPDNIEEECAKLYRKALSMGLIKGRSIEGSVAALIYFISREYHVSKTLKELAEVSGVGKRDIGRAYSFFCKEMELKTSPSNAGDYVHRFAGSIGLSGEAEAKAIELLETAKKIGATAGRSPVSIAAAIIYFASGMPLKEISGKIPEVGVTTLRKRCREMAGELGLELNEEL